MTVLLLEIDSTPQENLLSIKLSREEHETFRLLRVGTLQKVPQALRETYHQWSCIYQHSYANRIKPSVEQPTHLTDDYDEWKQKIEQNKDIEEKLKKYINQWLNDLRNEEWRQVRDLIVANIQTDFEQEEVIILVRSPDQNLLKLPWHLWNIFDERNIEVCPSWGIKVDQKSVKKQQQRINILVIISEDKNLNTWDEERLWNNLKSSLVNVEVLKNPNQHEFAKLWTQNWDLLYYAGHSHTKDNSRSGEAGHFWINSDVCLTTNKLKETFKQAINNGLKLAIFNSCDGLGLAKDLTELSTPLPQVIFMRERIPDCVASKFLEDFLDAFQRGESISASVHQARGQLKEVSNFPIQLPGISLMPVVAWTLYTPMLKWQDFLLNDEQEKGNNDSPETKPKLRKYWLFLLLLSSVLSVMGIRLRGWLQGVELSAYDLMMKLRLSETSGIIDSRIVVIEITEEETGKNGYPISDQLLANGIQNLASNQPSAIGVDIHRYQPRGQGREELIQLFSDYPRLITVCAFGRDNNYYPPTDIKPSQIGFSNLIDDDLSESNSKIRRQLLSYNPEQVKSPSSCTHQQSSFSLSFKLAYTYLASQGIKPIQANSEQNWQFGETVFPRLPKRFGAYQNLDGNVSEIMINYHDQPLFSRHFSLSEVLEQKIKPEWIKDKIILIGYSSPTAGDISSTPMGDLPGVWIHAQMTSQIISAVLDERSQIRAFSQWGDGFVVLFASTLSAIVVLSVRKLSPHLLILKLSLGFVTWSIILFFVYLSFLESGLWLPFIPSILASFLVFTIGSILCTRYPS